MGYTKAWISSITPARNNLAVWKEMMKEIHSNLVESGWLQTDEPGQIADLDAVPSFPAAADYSMFRIYELDDGHQELGRIFMKVAFTQHDLFLSNANSSNRRSAMPGPAIWVSDDITFSSSKTMFCAYPSNGTGGGASSNMSYTTGQSMICSNPELGFYGSVFWSGAYICTDTNYSITRSPFSIMIQRNLKNDGDLAPGFGVWTGTSNHAVMSSGSSNTKNSRMGEYKASNRFIGPEYVSPVREDSAVRPFTEIQTALPGGVVQISPVYMMTPEVKQVPTLVSYIDDQVAVGTQFEAETVGGNRYNFITTGQSCIYADTAAPFAMLFQ